MNYIQSQEAAMSNKKDLLSQLRKENQRLRRELARYRKYSNKFADIVLESWDEQGHDEEDSKDAKRKKVTYCDRCGKGELKDVSILGIDFVVCQLCKYRKKLP